MSVADQLGIEDDPWHLLEQARRRWCGWAGAQPALVAVADVSDLRGWLKAALPAAADEVLLALARLAAVDDGDDTVAASVLAWVMLPAACNLAMRLQALTPTIDEAVAAQLWIHVRTFPWQRRRRVAANIIWDTRAAVLDDHGVVRAHRRMSGQSVATTVVDPGDPWWEAFSAAVEEPEPEPTDPVIELSAVLERACVAQILADSDRQLLLGLLYAAKLHPTRRVRRGAGGLLSDAISAHVGADWGIAPVTVRRRARSSISRLREMAAAA